MVGFNLRVNVWRIDQDPDDNIGGAMLTGALLYTGIQARLEDEATPLILQVQGLETTHIYNCMVRPTTLDIHENDEVVVTHPYMHMLLGQRLKVLSVQRDSMPQRSRGHIEMRLTKIVRTRKYP